MTSPPPNTTSLIFLPVQPKVTPLPYALSYILPPISLTFTSSPTYNWSYIIPPSTNFDSDFPFPLQLVIYINTPMNVSYSNQFIFYMTCSILLFFFDLIGGDGAPLPKVEKIHSTSHSQPTTTSDWANGSSSGGGSSSGAGGGGVIEVTSTTAAAEVIAAVENKGVSIVIVMSICCFFALVMAFWSRHSVHIR